MDNLLAILENPIVQDSVMVLTKTRPEIGIVLQLAIAILKSIDEHHQMNVAIQAVDKMATEHIKQLIASDLSPTYRSEIEIRLHEVLTVLVRLGGIS